MVMILRLKCTILKATWNMDIIRYQVSCQYCWFCLSFPIVQFLERYFGNSVNNYVQVKQEVMHT
jgi:hypothetical protein